MRVYKDLLIEIEIYELVVADLRKKHRSLRKRLLSGPEEIKGYDISKDRGQSVHKTVDKEYEEYVVIQQRLRGAEQRLSELKKLKKKIDLRVKKLEGLDYQVVLLRDIEGLRLTDIAEELGYSEDWIKRISSRNPRS